jgi:hypothetical protein
MCRRPEILILAFFVKKILEVSKCTTGVQGNYTHSHSGPPRRVRPDFNPRDSILLEAAIAASCFFLAHIPSGASPASSSSFSSLQLTDPATKDSS